MIMLESGPDDTHAARYYRRQTTRVSKIDVFSQLQSFAKLPNQIRFSNFRMLYGSFLDASHKNAVKIGFCEISFFTIF